VRKGASGIRAYLATGVADSSFFLPFLYHHTEERKKKKKAQTTCRLTARLRHSEAMQNRTAV
jgi:hypothetical protein